MNNDPIANKKYLTDGHDTWKVLNVEVFLCLGELTVYENFSMLFYEI